MNVQPTWEDVALRYILEGTATHTGREFFDALVKFLCRALEVKGSWVTEYLPESRRLRALSFWFEDRYIPDYEYDIAGTPCEPVVEKSCLIHYPENVISLFPADPDLKRLNAVSYLGAPLLSVGGDVLGHLAVLHSSKLELTPRVEALFRIFGDRATAELRRLRAEAAVREREQKLSRLVDSALDAIIELDGDLAVAQANRAAETTFRCEAGAMAGSDFRGYLAGESGRKLSRLAEELQATREGKQSLWVPNGFTALRPDGSEFPAEASLSRFEVNGRSHFTLILRNVHDQREAERRIEVLTTESGYLKNELEELYGVKDVVGQSRAMLDLFEDISRVAPTDSTVLIYGETGTGKELVARSVHAASSRAGRPLIKVNCAAIPAALMESEFFGHERGAFTGATQRREGRFALADGGTIFLDEIGELPVELQPKLLRVLQEGEFEPVGSSRSRTVNVRVIAATNRELQGEIQAGRFREDLYYRLSVFPVHVPPLRERGRDIELLAGVFAEKICRRIGCKPVTLTPQCIRRLQSYHWPGNVRELQNVIERGVITARDGRLNLDTALPRTAPAAIPADHASPHTAQELRDLERANLLRALESASWRVSGPNGAASLLGLPPSTLASRMKALGIRRPRGD